MLKMIVFLGNPGARYRLTRHNVGRMVCERLQEKLPQTDSWQTKFHGQFIKKGSCILLLPGTFMNENGISVREASDFFGVKPQDVLVVHDDIELPFGTVKMQVGGGMGGHNGLRSVKKHLGTDGFGRLRVGVGRPPSDMQVADFVLARFSPSEEKELQTVLDNAAETALEYIG